MNRTRFHAAALALGVSLTLGDAGAAHAIISLVTNGSFELGSDGLAGRFCNCSQFPGGDAAEQKIASASLIPFVQGELW
jgi:hypothetical protein